MLRASAYAPSRLCTMTLQYLDALKTIGTGESTKVLLPMVTALLRPLVDHTAAASDGED